MSRCFAAGLDIHDNSAPPPPRSIATNILAPDYVPSYYTSSPGWEKPRSAGTLESVVNQSIISHRRRHKSTGDGGNHHQPAAVITTDALVPACNNYNNSIHTYNYNNNNQHVLEFIPDEPYSGAAAAAGTKHGGAGVCSCKNNASRRGDRRQGDAGKRGEYGKFIIPTNKSRAAANALHNLSEKKRREKINQRMKILQKLVPNCSKTDKASVLDDAIEYLKLLQAQVQMMMNMPSMMLPPTMQQHLPWDVQQHSSLAMPDFISAFLASQSQPMTMDAYCRMATFYQQLQLSPNNAGSNN